MSCWTREQTRGKCQETKPCQLQIKMPLAHLDEGAVTAQRNTGDSLPTEGRSGAARGVRAAVQVGVRIRERLGLRVLRQPQPAWPGSWVETRDGLEQTACPFTVFLPEFRPVQLSVSSWVVSEPGSARVPCRGVGVCSSCSLSPG